MHSKKCIWKCSLQNGGHFVKASKCYVLINRAWEEWVIKFHIAFTVAWFRVTRFPSPSHSLVIYELGTDKEAYWESYMSSEMNYQVHNLHIQTQSCTNLLANAVFYVRFWINLILFYPTLAQLPVCKQPCLKTMDAPAAMPVLHSPRPTGGLCKPLINFVDFTACNTSRTLHINRNGNVVRVTVLVTGDGEARLRRLLGTRAVILTISCSVSVSELRYRIYACIKCAIILRVPVLSELIQKRFAICFTNSLLIMGSRI